MTYTRAEYTYCVEVRMKDGWYWLGTISAYNMNHAQNIVASLVLPDGARETRITRAKVSHATQE